MSLNISSINGNYYSNNNEVNSADLSSASKSFQNTIAKTSSTYKGYSSGYTMEKNGNVAINIPPNITTSNSIDATKSKEDMTMDEYKEYICNKISQIPVSAYHKSTFAGQMVITDACFERMKSEPEWEADVLDFVKRDFSTTSAFNAGKNSYMQVIGDSWESTYGYGGPIGGTSGIFSAFKDTNEKSWWQERHEKMEELLKEQVKKAQQIRAAKEAVKMQEIFAAQQQQKTAYSNFLNAEQQSAENISDATVSIIASESASKVVCKS